MTPAARIAAVIEILAEMQAANAAGTLLGRQAGQWLRAGLQRRRYAGSGDRAAVGDLFWKIQRGRARLGWHLASIDAPANPRNITLAALVLMEQKTAVLPQLFSAEIAYAPAPLDDCEAVLVTMLETREFTDPAMPEHIALEWPFKRNMLRHSRIGKFARLKHGNEYRFAIIKRCWCIRNFGRE